MRVFKYHFPNSYILYEELEHFCLIVVMIFAATLSYVQTKLFAQISVKNPTDGIYNTLRNDPRRLKPSTVPKFVAIMQLGTDGFSNPITVSYNLKARESPLYSYEEHSIGFFYPAQHWVIKGFTLS